MCSSRLTAVDLVDGRFTGISYDSPTPTARRLQALRVPLTQKANALGLLDALHGAGVGAAHHGRERGPDDGGGIGKGEVQNRYQSLTVPSPKRLGATRHPY
jgi:hypothetical protein